MQKVQASQIFESLSSPIRLDIFRGLVRAGPPGMVAGQIASALNIAANKLSFHLKGMVQNGLVSVEQEGRYQRYRANFALMTDLIAYLTEECCAGRNDLCPGLPSQKTSLDPNCCPLGELPS